MSHLFENEDTEVCVKSVVSDSIEAVLVESLGPHVKGTGPSQAMMLICFIRRYFLPFTLVTLNHAHCLVHLLCHGPSFLVL